jgi:superfamily II DNA or RNA helicase
MSELFTIEDINSFNKIRDVLPREIIQEVLETIKNLDERNQIEPFIRASIFDLNETPHGPIEIADIYTHKIRVKDKKGLAAFIIKGKSFKTIRSKDISHQIFKLRKITNLNYSILVFTGKILDDAKEEFIKTAQDINSNYALIDDIDLARLFISEGFICPRDGNVIEGLSCKCGYSPKRKELNIFQKEALKGLKKSHKINQLAGLVILPPASGKTRIAAKDSYDFKANKVLYIAHSHEILDIAEEEFSNIFGKKEVNRIFRTEDFRGNKSVYITTIQLITRNFNRFSKYPFNYLIIDEFHHSAAKTYRKLIRGINYNYLLGLTATPFRGDRQDIAKLCYDNVIINYDLRTGIDYGILSPFNYIGCFDNIDYSEIKKSGSKYNIRDLEKALLIPERDEAILEKWIQYLENKQTVAFCCSKKHAYRCCDLFNNNGINSKVFLSDTPYKVREQIKKDFKKGIIKLIFTVDVLNEGVDFPFVEGLLFLRPTESERIFYQQMGRGLRRFTGKREAVILDFIGNFKNAYKIVEYIGLTPEEDLNKKGNLGTIYNSKEILNLPTGCKVTFEDEVIDIFYNQIINRGKITRYNIARILIYRYEKLCNKLNKLATSKDVDRNCWLDSSLYSDVFGSWGKFISIISDDPAFTKFVA